MAESGIADLNLSASMALLAPAKTPRAIIDQPGHELHQLSEKRLAKVHDESPKKSIWGNYSQSHNRCRNSNRHQIKTAANPRGYWLLAQTGRRSPDTTELQYKHNTVDKRNELEPVQLAEEVLAASLLAAQLCATANWRSCL